MFERTFDTVSLWLEAATAVILTGMFIYVYNDYIRTAMQENPKMEYGTVIIEGGGEQKPAVLNSNYPQGQ